MYSIEVEREISMGHRLMLHEGKCQFLHGHNYLVKVQVECPFLGDNGMLVDFGEIKKVIDRFDHKMVLWNEDSLLKYLTTDDAISHGIIKVDFHPTIEELCRYWGTKVGDLFLKPAIVTVEGWETEKCSAAWRGTFPRITIKTDE